jgi:hypothetical protein
MFEDIYLPEPLYHAWPYLCFAIAAGYAAVGIWPVSVLMFGYGAFLKFKRGCR